MGDDGGGNEGRKKTSLDVIQGAQRQGEKKGRNKEAAQGASAPCAAILITGYLTTSSAGKGYFPSRTSLLGPYILMMM